MHEKEKTNFTTWSVYKNEVIFEEEDYSSVVRWLVLDFERKEFEPYYYAWGFKEVAPGQFFMLRSKRTKTTLGRPISVFYADISEKNAKLHFLIQEKGVGTMELCDLIPGEDEIEILGPLGNSFPDPEFEFSVDFVSGTVAIIGGGIGIAPVSYFAQSLHRGWEFDFFACFKSEPYAISGLSGYKVAVPSIKEAAGARNVYIATEDGSEGTEGMLDAILDVDTLSSKDPTTVVYDAVYACGPEPMLKYVQKICHEAGVKCFLSLESHMACGMGACLGCSISTRDGKKKVCKDGPVFPSEIVEFQPREKPLPTIYSDPRLGYKRFPSLLVEVAGVWFENPVIAASGTFGFGTEYQEIVDVSKLGGICSKGLTLEGSDGNPGIRVYETSGGMLNSIGLENPGVPHFIREELPKMRELGPVVIANLSGHSYKDYEEGAKLLDASSVDMIELNISCPNVATGGMTFGMDPVDASRVTSIVRKCTTKPLIVKLTPNAMDLKQIIIQVVKSGADAISLVNTFQAMEINIETGRPVFKNTYAGLSGPGIKPIALRMVHQAAKTIDEYCDRKVPVIGLGGITTWEDAVKFIMAGASAIQVGTATFGNPHAMEQIIGGIKDFMRVHGYERIEDFRGLAL